MTWKKVNCKKILKQCNKVAIPQQLLQSVLKEAFEEKGKVYEMEEAPLRIVFDAGE